MTEENLSTYVWEYYFENNRILLFDNGSNMTIDNVPESMIANHSVYPDDEESYRNIYEAMNGGTNNVSQDIRYLSKYSVYTWYRIEYRVVEWKNDKPKKAIGVARDITVIKDAIERYENEVKNKGKKTEGTQVYIRSNLTKNIVEVYDAVYPTPIDYTKYPSSEVILMTSNGIAYEYEKNKFRELFHHDKLIGDFRQGITSVSYEYRRRLGDGRIAWVCSIANVVCNPETGDIIAFIYGYDVDAERRQRLLNKDLVRRLSIVLGKTYDFAFEVNFTTSEVFDIVFHSEGSVERKANKDKVADYLRRWATLCLDGEDRSHFMNLFNYGNLNSRFKKGIEEINQNVRMVVSEQKGGEWFSFWVRRLEWECDKDKVIIVYAKNINDLMQEEDEKRKLLADALNSANQANATKTMFLSNMSHEIRTPMNAIIGMTQVADMNISNQAKVRDCLDKIQTSSQHLLGIINDILDMSKIDTGNMVLNKTVFTLEELITDVKVMVIPQINNKLQHFNVSVNADLTSHYEGDLTRIKQILINVISNSMKYTPPEGDIDLIINKVKGKRDDYTYFEFKIKDSGIGMSKEFLENIYEPFSQEIQSSRNSTVGTGLGMAITRNLINLMNGMIDIESELGKGTTVKITLVLGNADVNTVGEYTSEKSRICNSTTDFTGKNVLLVEDNDLNAEIAMELIRSLGANVFIVSDGNEAVNSFCESTNGFFDIIFMDIMMPECDGYQATRLIRQSNHSDANSIPIVAMSANVFSEDVKNSIASGMNDHIAKPIDLSKVREVMAEYIR